MRLALVAMPSRSDSYTPALAAWLDPRSSQFRMRSVASGGWPSRSANVVTGATVAARAGLHTGPKGPAHPHVHRVAVHHRGDGRRARGGRAVRTGAGGGGGGGGRDRQQQGEAHGRHPASPAATGTRGSTAAR